MNGTLVAAPAEDVAIARLVAVGHTSAQIAERLMVTPGVARYRLRKAMERAGADTAPEFAALVLGRPVAASDLAWRRSPSSAASR